MRRARRILGGSRETTAAFSLIGTALFVTGLVLVHGFHEFWRDEMHCWSVGRNADGLMDLLTGQRRYDGHPFLWYYVLYLASRVYRGAAGLHAVTIVLAGGSCFLWLRYSGFPRFMRVLFLGTYLFFYEYGVMSRSYTLGIFFAFAFATLYRRQRTRFVLPAVVLALLGMTSVYGTIWSCALAIVLFSCGWKRTAPGSPLPGVLLPRSWFVGLALWLGAFALTAVTSNPPDDAVGYPWQMGLHLADVWKATWRVWVSLFPFRDTPGAWAARSSLWASIPAVLPWLPYLAGVLVALWALCYARSWRAVVCFIFGMTAMALFQQVKYSGGMRHWGHFMVFVVLCGWIFRRDTRGRRSLLLADLLLTGVFLVQCVTGARVIRAEIARPFSGADEAAMFIRSKGWQDTLLVGTGDHQVSAVAGYLDRPFVSGETGELVRSVAFHNRRQTVDPSGALSRAPRFLDLMNRSEAILIVSYDPGPTPKLDGFEVEPAYVTAPAPIVEDERFWLYRVTRKP